jgi:hypothetical protein
LEIDRVNEKLTAPLPRKIVAMPMLYHMEWRNGIKKDKYFPVLN